MKFFLRAKHWQLFILVAGIPFIAQIALIANFANSIGEGNPAEMFTPFLSVLFPIMMVTVTGIFFGWFYTMGINLHPKLPVTVNMPLTKFKIFLAIPLVYLFCIIIFMGVLFNSIAATNGVPNPLIFLLIVPLHLFSMFCIFYCLYFVAKCLKAVEWQRPVTFSDYAGEFFLIWFFPIGVWFIQPRINKLFDENLQDGSLPRNLL